MTAPAPKAAAAEAVHKKSIKGLNFVATDQIWKDHVRHEKESSNLWPQNWSFLKGCYEEMAAPPPPRTPTPLTIEEGKKPVEIPSHLDSSRSEKALKVGPPPPVPKTMNAIVGWRASEPGCNLERFGLYAKPRGCAVKNFGWPEEGLD